METVKCLLYMTICVCLLALKLPFGQAPFRPLTPLSGHFMVCYPCAMKVIFANVLSTKADHSLIIKYKSKVNAVKIEGLAELHLSDPSEIERPDDAHPLRVHCHCSYLVADVMYLV